MAKYVEVFTIRVRFLPEVGAEPVEEWTLTSQLEGRPIDEDALDEAVQQAIEQLKGQNTFELERRVRQGGWGASGVEVLQLVISVASGLAGNALYDLLVAVYKRFANHEPEVERKKLPAKARKKTKRKK